MRTTLNAFAAAVLLVSSGAAAEHKMRGLTFNKPESWAEKLSADAVLFQRAFTIEDQRGGAIIAIEAKPFYGDFGAAFRSAGDAIADMKEKDPTVENHGVTTTGHPMAWQLKCCSANGVPMQVVTVSFNPPGTLITVHLVIINADDNTEDAIEAEFDKLIAGFDFAGEGVRPGIPAIPESEQRLEGLWLNVSSGLAINPMGGMDFEVDMNTLYFDGEGRLAEEPPAGTDSLAAFCETKPTVCGVYAIAGGKLTQRMVGYRFGIVTEETDTLEVSKDRISIGRDEYFPIEPSDNLKLEGTWTSFWAQSGTLGGTSTAISSTRTLAFARDGRFNRSGFTSMSSNIESGDTNTSIAGSSETPEDHGTYSIDGYTLTLMADSGETEVLSLYLPDKADVDLLMIDGSSYLREGRD